MNANGDDAAGRLAASMVEGVRGWLMELAGRCASGARPLAPHLAGPWPADWSAGETPLVTAALRAAARRPPEPSLVVLAAATVAGAG